MTEIRDLPPTPPVAERDRNPEDPQTSDGVEASIIQHMPAAFFAVDSEFRLTYANDEAVRLLRKPREELLGRNVWEQLPMATETQFYAGAIKAMEEQTQVDLDDYYPPDDAWFEIHAYPTGSGLSMYFGDITSRKRAELDLRASDARASAILNSSIDCVVGMDGEGLITGFNRAAEKTFGYRREDVLGRFLADTIIPPSLRAAHWKGLERYVATGEGPVLGSRLELTAMRSDGSEFPVEVAITLVEGAGPTRFTGHIRDVTNRKQRDHERAVLLAAEQDARAAAEAGRERLAFLAEASGILAGSLDYTTTLNRLAELAVPRIADWCVIDMADHQGLPRLMSLAHRDPEKLRLMAQLRDRYSPGPWTPGSRQVIRTGRSEIYPEITDELLAAATSDGELVEVLRRVGVASAMTVPLRARGETIGAITFVSSDPDRLYGSEDLALAEELARHAGLAVDNARLYTEAEARAEEVQRLNEDLERRVADRTDELEASNRELEAFSYSVSHDLRAPLRAIDGFSKILVNDFAAGMPEQARDYLGIVREGAQQMGRLIDDLLAFARLGRQQITKREVETAELVRRALDQLRGETDGRDVDIRIGDLSASLADPALLQQVYVNLLANALKFSRTRTPAVIEVGTKPDPHGDVYYVRDNGVGFDMRYADKLFGVFQRLHRAEDYEGTGVGLAIVQRVVHRHGGRVWAHAEPDRGATFFFTLGDEHGDA